MNAKNIFEDLMNLSSTKIKEVLKNILVESNNVDNEILSLLNDESKIHRNNKKIVVEKNNDQLIVTPTNITWCAERIGPQVLLQF